MLIRKFQEQVERTPAALAVKDGNRSVTYEELHRSSDRIARSIRRQCRDNEETQTVALLLDHGLDMIAGILGTLKAGKIYVPLASYYPHKRLVYMLSHSQCSLLLAQSSLAQTATALSRETGIPFLEIDNDINNDNDNNNNDNENADEADVAPPSEAGSQPAYIMYTSGSTGRPKGVLQTHENVLYYINNWTRLFSIRSSDRMTLFSSFSHDGSVQDMFSALLNGAALYPLNMRDREDNLQLEDFLIDESITIWHSVPSLYNYFVNTLTGAQTFPLLRFILLGGEALRKHEVRMFNDHFPHSTLVNVYGQTESSVNSTWAIRPGDPFEEVVIGTPLDNTNIFLMDRRGRETAPLEPGEIIVACPHISPGYWQDEESTGKVFRAHPRFSRMYRTGDLGHRLLDGSIEFLGRQDNQVKIRGFRIELGEIESQLLTHESVDSAVVTTIETAPNVSPDEKGHGDASLCAYIVPVAGETRTLEDNWEDQLRTYLSDLVPDYMVPSFFVQLEELPRTGSGKVDRRALPAPQLTSGQDYTPPSNETEEKLVKIWSEALNIEEPIGIDDDFFRLGGHSLKAAVIISWVHEVFDVKCSLSAIFKTPTIRGLASAISTAGGSLHHSIGPVEQKDHYPLSSAQRRIFFLDAFDETGTGYNMPNILHAKGKLEMQRFEDTFRQLIRRHEVLRTSFHLTGDEPVQRVHDAEQVNFSIRYENVTIENFIAPFDLSVAPLIRAAVKKETEEHYILLLDMHHIICDGTSWTNLVEEFVKVFEGEELAPNPIQYKDFACWQNRLFQTGQIAKQQQYWLELFSPVDEIPRLNLPLDFPRPGVLQFSGDRYQFRLTRQVSQRFRQVAVRNGATLYMNLLAALNILLHKYTGETDIIIGTVTMGRTHVDLQRMIGMFVNALAMRSRPASHKTPLRFLEEVKHASLDALENQDLQFEELIDQLDLARDPSRNPLFDVVMAIQNFEQSQRKITGVTLEPYRYESKISKFDLTLYVYEDGDDIHFSLEYCTALFKVQTIQRMARHFLNVIHQISETPAAPISRINLLSEQEERQLLEEFNRTQVDYPKDKTLRQLFEEQAAKAPDRIALTTAKSDERLTYRQLGRQANRLASYLREQGVRPGSIVGIMLERSLEMIIGIYGILKAGGAYLPIDPVTPLKRIEYMLRDSGAIFCISDDSYKGKNNDQSSIINYQLLMKTSAFSAPSAVKSEPTNLSYIIYTSGSTGTPKGVMIEHHSVVNRLKWMQSD
ncbi:MAG: amino acid adenylation domain-containing protein, partial [bacterium]|nr:amino acid adenylation domain-containing protein [bacterium]